MLKARGGIECYIGITCDTKDHCGSILKGFWIGCWFYPVTWCVTRRSCVTVPELWELGKTRRSCTLCHLWLKIRLPVLWNENGNWIDHEKFYGLTSFLWNHTPKLNSKGSRRRFQALGVVVVFLKTWTGHSGQIWAYWSQSEKTDKYHLKSSGFIPFWN